MKKFDEEIKMIAEHFGREPIFDGIVSEKDYLNSNLKLLWILKDPNSSGEDGAWNMRSHIKNNLKTKNGILKGWSATFKKIIYVSNGILNNLSWNDEVFHPSYKPEVIDELKKIAYINIKKTGGGAVAINNEIQEYYNYSKNLLFNQIKEFKPNIIIFGGTYKFFHEDLQLVNLEDFGSCSAAFHNNILYIKAYHPMYTIKEEIYFNDIINAVRKYKLQF